MKECFLISIIILNILLEKRTKNIKSSRCFFPFYGKKSTSVEFVLFLCSCLNFSAKFYKKNLFSVFFFFYLILGNEVIKLLRFLLHKIFKVILRHCIPISFNLNLKKNVFVSRLKNSKLQSAIQKITSLKNNRSPF